MADYDGILILDPENDVVYSTPPVADIIIDSEDADDYGDSYEPTQGCTP